MLMNIAAYHKERGWPVRLTGDTPDGRVVLEEPMSAEAAAKIIAENREPVTWLDWKHRGSALYLTGSFREGLEAARKAVELHRSPATLLDLAVILEGFGRFDEALDLEREARQMEPANCFVGCIYANSLLRQGRYGEAWPIWECYGWHRGADIELAQYIPLWEGDDLAGKRILVLHAGGFGDQILFFRWFWRLRVSGAHITYVCPDVMVPLLEGHPWIDKLLLTHEGSADPAVGSAACQSPMASNKLDRIPEVDLEPSNFDCFISILNLGPLIAPTLNHLWMGSYISCSADPPHLRSATLPQVGICTQAGEMFCPRRYRSLEDHQIKQLLEVDVVDWINLDFRAAGLRQGGLRYTSPPWYPNPAIKNWLDTARLIAGLDLVVTVDTGVAHLAGAMGKPCWVILPALSAWMYGVKGHTTPFYPSMKLFRTPQGSCGVADATVERVAQALVAQTADVAVCGSL
jgi:hypothetical protein